MELKIQSFLTLEHLKCSNDISFSLWKKPVEAHFYFEKDRDVSVVRDGENLMASISNHLDLFQNNAR